jgi:hypothetical protein
MVSPLLNSRGVGAFVLRSFSPCKFSIRLLNDIPVRSGSCCALEVRDWISFAPGFEEDPFAMYVLGFRRASGLKFAGGSTLLRFAGLEGEGM